MQRYWSLENRRSALWRAEIRDDWYCAVAHLADRRRSPDPLPETTVVRAVGPPWHRRANSPPSNRYHPAREVLLRWNANPVAPAAARSRSRDARQQCVDPHQPAAGVLDLVQSRAGSSSLSSWPRLERPQPNPASPRRDSARSAERSATRPS